jgi:hypothetical protein
MSCSNTAVFSRGDSFASVWTWVPGEGEPADLLGTTITSTLRDKSGRDYELVVVLAVDGLSFTATFPGDSSGWALGLASWDIRFTFPGGPVTHSTIFRVQVQETITQA